MQLTCLLQNSNFNQGHHCVSVHLMTTDVRLPSTLTHELKLLTLSLCVQPATGCAGSPNIVHRETTGTAGIIPDAKSVA